MPKLLTASEVQSKYGYSPSSLKRWESEGRLAPDRTPGGHRRYDPAQIENLAKANGRTPPGGDIQPFREYGVTGISRFSGAIYEERLRELRGRAGREKYREMRLNDPVIAATMFGIISALKEPQKRVVSASDSPKDRAVAEFVTSCLEDMSWSWADTLDMILNPTLEQGFAVPELVYKKRLKGPSLFDDGLIGWRKWAPRPAESLADGKEWIYDAHGGIQGINQQPEEVATSSEPLVEMPGFRDINDAAESNKPNAFSIPIQKLLHFRTTLYPSNTPEGLSLLRAMYVSYHYTRHLQELEGIGVERDLAGIPIIYLGRGTSTNSDDPNSDWSVSRDLVENLRHDEQSGIVIPHPKMTANGDGVLVELLSTGGRRQWDVGNIIERYDKRKALSVLAQFIMLGMTQVGSYALSRHQGDLFVLAVSTFLQSIGEVINRHAIPRLLALNGWGDLPAPRLEFSPVGVPDLKDLSEFVNKLVERSVLTPDEELERHLRQIGGLPQPKATEVVGETKPKDSVRAADETALLIRRLTLAIKPLEELQALQPGEGAALLGPLVDELRTSLGNGNLPTDFETSQEVAAQKMWAAISKGEPAPAAAQEYVSTLKGGCPFCGGPEPEGAGVVFCKRCGMTWNKDAYK